MNFDNNFFDNEVRNGFFVCSLMKRAWAAQIDVLAYFDKICQENGLKYYADFGTLLGAVRHKGFIPWDDDIDVSMFREDIEKLRTLMDQSSHDGFRFSSIYNREDLPLLFDRFSTDSVIFGKENMQKRHGFPFIAGIDIFPIDYLPDDSEKRKKLFEDVNIIKFFLQRLQNEKNVPIPGRIKELADIYGCNLKDRKKLANQTRILFDKYSASYLKECGKDVAIMSEWMNNERKTFKREFYDGIVYLNFENIKVPAPKDYDKVLKGLFGDYMKPVLAEDKLHEYPFYQKQEKFIYEKTNVKLMDLNYKQIKERIPEEKGDIAKELNEHTDLLKKLLNCVLSLYSAGQQDNIPDMLTSAQDVVIKIGNKLENHYEEAVVQETVGILEEYCEDLYKAGISISEDTFLDYFKKLLEGWVLIKTNIDEILKNERPIAIAFIFEKEKDWVLYEKIYQELSNDKRFKCFIIPIPYYYRNNELEISKEDIIFEGDKIAEKYPIIDYKEFDFSEMVFDCIIKSNAYDEFSFGDTIHPFFYTQELKKVATRKVIHVPTIDIMDFKAEDSRIMYMTKFFIKTPSVLLSDYILLRSNVLRQRYCEILSETTGESWNEKVKMYSDVKEIKQMIYDICV